MKVFRRTRCDPEPLRQILHAASAGEGSASTSHILKMRDLNDMVRGHRRPCRPAYPEVCPWRRKAVYRYLKGQVEKSDLDAYYFTRAKARVTSIFWAFLNRVVRAYRRYSPILRVK